ncbi:hypothetical protein [Legionella geestiana]|nr:hypothetical protein [Legionella geestiana]QBS11951.1 type IV secretion protein IcmC [Legionella geestiana]QDQ40436.1 type IV secretion protein IcmC [Legionella geestiana]
MEIPDWITMLGNLSRSLDSVERFLTAGAYVIGIAFFFIAVIKFKHVLASRGGSREPMSVPFAYLIAGAALLYLPSSVVVLSNTTFGPGNILEYAKWSPFDVISSMEKLIKVAGIIWFMRGVVLMTNASAPGVQHGPKGLAFLVAGVCAINYETTAAVLNYLVTALEKLTTR